MKEPENLNETEKAILEELKGLDPTGECLEMLRAGDRQALIDMHQITLDQLSIVTFPDDRVRLWLIEYLTSKAPKPKGRPDVSGEHLNWAIFVERNKRRLKASGIKGAKAKAIRLVAKAVHKAPKTVEEKIRPYKIIASDRVDRYDKLTEKQSQ